MSSKIILGAKEPVEMKNEIRNAMQSWKTESWDYQSLSAWYGNRIPQYLWTQQAWKFTLEKFGWTWQTFLKMCSLHTNDFIRWITEGMEWDDLVRLLSDDINNQELRKMYFYRKGSKKEMIDYNEIGLELRGITLDWFDSMPDEDPTLRWKKVIPLWAERYSTRGVRYTPAHEKLNEIECSPFSIGILIEHEKKYDSDLDRRIQGMHSDLMKWVPGYWIHSKNNTDMETRSSERYHFKYHAFSIVFKTAHLYNSSDK